MEHSKKIVYNTFALSIKIVLTCIVQLVATRIALSALGQEAFGLYNLLAGIIVLFTFLTGALMISTQRYLSIAIGEKNNQKLKQVFNVSLLIHFFIAIFIFLFLLLVKPFLFNSFLNIGDDYVDTAKVMYNMLLLSVFVTIITIPYSANINAREDMVFFAVSEIISLLFKLWAAISLLLIKGDLLLIYTIFMVLAVFVGAITKISWCMIKYDESKISILLMKNRILFKEMIGFVSWNTLGTAAVVIRNQGVAILLNIFYGTVINAAYGIANQVNSLVLSFATTLTTVFTPSIVQQKGAGNEQRMIELATLSSKLSFGLSSLMALPILIYLDDILLLWLKDIPIYTESFVFWIILIFLIQQLYPGINRAIYAVGRIKAYQISISILLMFILPIGYYLLKQDYNVIYILVVMFILQIACLISTVYYASKECNLNSVYFYIHSVFKPCIVFFLTLFVFYFYDKCIHEVESIWIVIVYSIFYDLIYGALYYMIVLSSEERMYFKKVWYKFKK